MESLRLTPFTSDPLKKKTVGLLFLVSNYFFFPLPLPSLTIEYIKERREWKLILYAAPLYEARAKKFSDVGSKKRKGCTDDDDYETTSASSAGSPASPPIHLPPPSPLLNLRTVSPAAENVENEANSVPCDFSFEQAELAGQGLDPGPFWTQPRIIGFIISLLLYLQDDNQKQKEKIQKLEDENQKQKEKIQKLEDENQKQKDIIPMLFFEGLFCVM